MDFKWNSTVLLERQSWSTLNLIRTYFSQPHSLFICLFIFSMATLKSEILKLHLTIFSKICVGLLLFFLIAILQSEIWKFNCSIFSKTRVCLLGCFTYVFFFFLL